jgi:hypothetical protein
MKFYNPSASHAQVENSTNAIEIAIEPEEIPLADFGLDAANLPKLQERYAEIEEAQREAVARMFAPLVQVSAELMPSLVEEAAAIAQSVKAGAPIPPANESAAIYIPASELSGLTPLQVCDPTPVALKPSLADFATVSPDERETRMKAAARAYSDELRGVRSTRARAAFRHMTAALAAKVRAAIKSAFVVMSRAVRQPRRARRPASRAAAKASASSGDGGGGQADDDASHIPAPPNLSPWPTPNLPPWASGVADERHSPETWDWLRRAIAAGGGAYARPGWLGDEARAGLAGMLAAIDKLKAARGREARGEPPRPGDKEAIYVDEWSKHNIGATGWRGASSRVALAFAGGAL